MRIDTVLLKVASRCNLDCSYCYVYNLGDNSWRAMPKFMALETQECVAAQLGRLCAAETIRAARRWRKLLGGGMRQVGVLTAAGLYALEHMVDRLEDDHVNAKLTHRRSPPLTASHWI